MNRRTRCFESGFLSLACGVGAFVTLALALPEPAGAQQPIDLAILGCSIVDGPTPDTIDLVMQVGVLTPETGGWDIPIDIFLNGALAEPQHKLTMEKNFLQACQQTFPDCQLPSPCGFTKWSYKGRGPFFENWHCLANFNTHACDCVDPGAPYAHKTVPRPPVSSFFDIFVDLDNLVPETNENNNHCQVFYPGPVPALNRSWGALKDIYYR
jgi:hypothetical protein